MTHISRVYLYDDADSPGLDIDYLAGFLVSEVPGLDVGVRTHFLTHQIGNRDEKERDLMVADLSTRLEATRAVSLFEDGEFPLPVDDPDEVVLAAPLQSAFRSTILKDESGLDHLHIVFTSEFLAELTAAGGLKLGVAALGAPTIISTAGLVEAPERPKEYHFKRVQYVMLGAAEYLEDIDEEFADRTVSYGDPRTNELIKGYILQAIVYRATGNASCSSPTCPLHAATTQQGMLNAQVGPDSRICAYHREILNAVAEGHEA